jgi:YVTN family beta-propeller protein
VQQAYQCCSWLPPNSWGFAIPVGNAPVGVAVTPDSGKVYVANLSSNSVSVIATTDDTVIGTIPVGEAPVAFGVFIQPRFAGTPGSTSCYGQSTSALTRVFGGLNAAATALGFDSVDALQKFIEEFCEA